MREHLYRAKTLFGDWVEGLLSQSFGIGNQPERGFYISNSMGSPWAYAIRPETLGENTGEKDINGISIWEGDIVHVYYGAGKVVFNAGCFMIEWLHDKEANMELLSMQNYKTGRRREDLVVTGNVFDNSQY